ncbi:MAG: hypothetical protein SH821_11130 [Phototrophicales bacterium]|nr:hypothetical protein [Phototrophicales bacterium]
MTATDNLPIAGRDDQLTRIQSQLANAPQEPLVVIGRKSIGKTLFLHQLATITPPHIIPIIIALTSIDIDDESHFWVMTSQHIVEVLEAHGIGIADIPLNESGRVWFVDGFFPAVVRAMRQRDLLLLWDDAHRLLDNNLPDDIFSALRGLCSAQAQMIFAFDIAYEDRLGQFMPFIIQKHQLRLGNLSRTGCETILRSHLDSIGDDMIEAIYVATGGLPHLVQRYGDEMGGEHANIKTMNTVVYDQSVKDFLAMWSACTPDEQLVLTAIADLFYDDPLRPILTTTIATWSVQSDYLLDETAINAVLRGLLYAEFIRISNHQIAVNGDLFRKWLLENARIVGDKSQTSQAIPMNLIIGGIIIIGIAILLLLASFGDTTSSSGIIPTVTILP